MMVNSTSPTFPPTRMVTASRTPPHMPRPSTSVSSRTPRSSSVNTMSAAPRAADEPRPLTPMPTSAIRIAAASLAPSPTIAVTRPHRCSAPTICTFCSGLTRANTCTSATSLAAASSSRPIEFGAGDHPCIVGQPQLAGDRPRGHRVVAGDQHDVEAGIHQRFDQRARRRACGVRQPDVADQFQIVRGRVDGVGIGAFVVGGVLPVALRDGQHPQALLGEVVHQRLRVIQIGLRVGEPAARQDDFWGALEHQHGLRGVRVERADRGGETAAGLERDLGEQVPFRHRCCRHRIPRP